MSRVRSLAIVVTVAILGFAAPLSAQSRTAVSGAELDAAVSTRPAERGQAVRALLSTAQAQAAARQLGVSPTELSARVAGLDNATLEQMAQQAGVADQPLAGGDTVVISTTLIIIVLLILILLST
jgi:hypothetical protein